MASMLRIIAGLIAGGFIGAGFGMVQEAARRRNERLQQAGKLSSGWAVMPGSGARVAYLLIALVLVQILCPLLFEQGTKWWVSAGIGVGYGWILLRRLLPR
jgi:MFS family permease